MLKWVFSLALLLLPTAALAQTGTVQGYCDQGGVSAAVSGLPSTNKLQGNIPSCTITVYFTGTQTLVPGNQIFKDAAGTVLGNPFTADALSSLLPGHFIFWAATGVAYDVTGKGGIAPNVYPQTVPLLTDVFPGAPGGGGGGSCSGTSPQIAYFGLTGNTCQGDPLFLDHANSLTNGGLEYNGNGAGFAATGGGDYVFTTVTSSGLGTGPSYGNIDLSTVDSFSHASTGKIGLSTSTTGSGSGIINISSSTGSGQSSGLITISTLGTGASSNNIDIAASGTNDGFSGNVSLGGTGKVNIFAGQTKQLLLSNPVTISNAAGTGFAILNSNTLSQFDNFTYNFPRANGTLALTGTISSATAPLCANGTGGVLTDAGCTGGGGSGVSSINTVPGAYTFTFSTGAGSCTGTTCNFTGSGTGGAVSSVFGRTGAVVPATNDYSFAQISGTATLAQLPALTLANVGAGASPTGLFDFSAATHLKLPSRAGYTAAASGEIGYDTTNLNLHFNVANTDLLAVGFPSASGLPVNGHCMQWTIIGAWLEATDAGAPCGSGGGSGISGLTAGFIPLAGSATTLTANSHLNDGISAAATITSTEPFAVNDGTGKAGAIGLLAGTAPSAAPANTIQINAPTAVTAYALNLPGAQPTAGNTRLDCTATNPAVCTWAAAGGSSFITSLTTTGTSGAATVTSGVLNIPIYAGGSCPTCVTSAAALTNNAVVIGGGLQASSTISADTTTTHALFATAGAPAFRALASTDIPVLPNANLANPSTTVNGTTCTLGSTCTVGIALATTTVGTTAIAANTCTTATTVTMTGVATTSTFAMTPNGDVSGIAGWGTTGGLTIDAWPTLNTLNYKVCNQTAASITPGASVTFNVSAR